MKRFILLAVFTIIGQQLAVAAPVTATGPAALALAAVIAPYSPLLRPFDRRIIARLFGGRTNFGFTPNTNISVTADSIVCRTNNVDITTRTCDLTFGVRKRTLTGREANEVSATGLTAVRREREIASSSLKPFRSRTAQSTRMSHEEGRRMVHSVRSNPANSSSTKPTFGTAKILGSTTARVCRTSHLGADPG